VRTVVCLAQPGAHGVTRPTFTLPKICANIIVIRHGIPGHTIIQNKKTRQRSPAGFESLQRINAC
jgi:hypothetical protein